MVRAPWRLTRGRRRAIVLSVVVATAHLRFGRDPSRARRHRRAAAGRHDCHCRTRRSRRADARGANARLADPCEGRRTGSPGGLAARRFVRDAFADHRTRLRRAPISFSRSHSNIRALPASCCPADPGRQLYNDAANVIGIQAGSRRDASTIVVSAHYDHVGVRDGVMYPGADDNASGVAALLAIARVPPRHTRPTHRVVLAAFDAEELGLEGAAAFLRSTARAGVVDRARTSTSTWCRATTATRSSPPAPTTRRR